MKTHVSQDKQSESPKQEENKKIYRCKESFQCHVRSIVLDHIFIDGARLVISQHQERRTTSSVSSLSNLLAASPFFSLEPRAS